MTDEDREYDVAFHYLVVAESPDRALDEAQQASVIDQTVVTLVRDPDLDGDEPARACWVVLVRIDALPESMEVFVDETAASTRADEIFAECEVAEGYGAGDRIGYNENDEEVMVTVYESVLL